MIFLWKFPFKYLIKYSRLLNKHTGRLLENENKMVLSQGVLKEEFRIGTLYNDNQIAELPVILEARHT